MALAGSACPGPVSFPHVWARSSPSGTSTSDVALGAVPKVDMHRRPSSASLPASSLDASHIAALAAAVRLGGCALAVAKESGRYPRSKRCVRIIATATGDTDEKDDSSEGDSEMSLVDMLIKKSRNASELGICTREWHPDLFDYSPDGYELAVNAGVDFVDVLANGPALKLLANAPLIDKQPRYNVRVVPKPTLGLGLILNKRLVEHFTVLGPLQQTMNRLGVGYVESLAIHCPQGRMNFPFWVYDAVAQAYQRGLCMRIGVSCRNATAKDVERAQQELQRRGVALSCVFLELSLLDRQALPLVQECRSLGLQVYASEPLGPDELASGRYSSSNPTGGEISVPRFTLAQLMPLRPLHDALSDVARKARARCEKPEIDTTHVALQWVVGKGASPLCDVTTDSNARAAAGCSGWALTPEEAEKLDLAADEVAKSRRKW